MPRGLLMVLVLVSLVILLAFGQQMIVPLAIIWLIGSLGVGAAMFYDWMLYHDHPCCGDEKDDQHR